MSVVRSVVVVLSVCCLGFAAQAADVAAGQAAYALCSTCHGPQGEGNVAMNAPKIAGQEPWYLERQVEAFKKGWRGTAAGDVTGMQMKPMAMTLATQDAVDNVIAYIGTLPPKPPPVTVSGDAEAGKTAFAVCVACHGQNAEGLEALGGPKLAGQDDWYLVRQIKNFKTGKRGYHPEDVYGNQMKPMAATLVDDAAINNVVAYINSLQ